MTADEAFKKFLTTHEHNDLPWEMQEEEMRPTFMAGWHAKAESLKQTDLPLGGGEDYTAPLVPTGGHYGMMERKPEKTEANVERELCAATIYAAYPRTIGKQAALKAISKAIKGHMGSERVSVTAGMAEMLRLTRLYAAATARWPAHERKYIPHPATWYNRGSYDDDPKEWQRGAAAVGSQFKTVRT